MTDAPWLDDVEGDALPELILSDAPVIRVIAGPGSGKTHGLKRRIRRLVERDGVNPNRIFVGTFTRAIAFELARELGTPVDYEEQESTGGGTAEPVVSTLHSLALRMLKEHPVAVAGRRFRFLLGFEVATMLYDIGHELPELATQTDRGFLKNRVTSGWAGGTTLGDEMFRGAMLRWLERHGGMLIEEVVYLAREGLRHGDIPRGLFDHVLIDEYQDLTFAEQDLVEDLRADGGSLVILGDDNQSIYGFRDNHPSGVSEFGRRHETVVDIDLSDNFRCGPDIVELANVMMAQAGSHVVMAPKRTITVPVVQVYWDSVDEEVDGLAKYIHAHPKETYLVLTPRRFMGYRLSAAVGDDAATAFYEETLESHLARERFILGSLLSDGNDAVAARCWIGFKGDVPEEAPSRNAAACASLGAIPTVDVLAEVAEGRRSVAGQGSLAVRRRAERLATVLAEAPTDPRAVIEFVFDPALAQGLPSKRQVKSAADLVALREGALAVLEAQRNDDLAKVFSTLRYRIATRLPLETGTEPRVRIMTLHGAKGLEADAVILMGVADQVVPGPSSSDPIKQEARKEEQRRLLYVAVTRARDLLIISWPKAAKYADGLGERIRNDGVFTRDGTQYFALSRSTLLPPTSALAVPGERWLEQQAKGEL